MAEAAAYKAKTGCSDEKAALVVKGTQGGQSASGVGCGKGSNQKGEKRKRTIEELYKEAEEVGKPVRMCNNPSCSELGIKGRQHWMPYKAGVQRTVCGYYRDPAPPAPSSARSAPPAS